MLTAVLRHTWGFSEKDRSNHLHHAIDAIIIAYSTHSIIKAFSDFKKEQELLKAKSYEQKLKYQTKFFEPFEGFREKVLNKIDTIFVSQPPKKEQEVLYMSKHFVLKMK